MNQTTLPSAKELLTDSWRFLKTHWSALKNYVYWYFGLFFCLSLVALIQDKEGQDAVYTAVNIIVSIITAWITLRLIRVILDLHHNKAPQTIEQKEQGQLLLSYIWIEFLTGLILLGAFILFIFPGIYLSISLIFVLIFLVDENLRGTKAIAASYGLVKGRWWSVFGRVLVPSVLVGLLMLAIVIVALIITGIVHFISPGLISQFPGTSGDFLFNLIIYVVLSPIMVFYYCYLIKLYLALKHTKATV